MPGVDLKETVNYFNDLLKDFIIEKSKQDLTSPDNIIVVMTGVDSDNDLILLPVEINKKEKTIQKEFQAFNTSAIIRETNIDKAIDLYCEKDCTLSFFQVLEKCKLL